MNEDLRSPPIGVWPLLRLYVVAALVVILAFVGLSALGAWLS